MSFAFFRGLVGWLVGLLDRWLVINSIRTEAIQRDSTRNASVLERIPAGRWGEPDDFKGPIVFLASAASNYVSGELIVVDGVSLSLF